MLLILQQFGSLLDGKTIPCQLCTVSYSYDNECIEKRKLHIYLFLWQRLLKGFAEVQN